MDNHKILLVEDDTEISMKEIEEMSLAYVELEVTNTKHASFVLTDKLELTNFKVIDGSRIRIYDNKKTTQEITKILTMNDIEVTAISRQTESLEDYFLKLTGEVKGNA